MKMAHTCTIILPLDRRKGARLATLLEMCSHNTVMPYTEIAKVMPRTTLHEILYTLRLVEDYVEGRFGFRLFEFKTITREDGKAAKVMLPLTKMGFDEIKGTGFVTFTRELAG
ncbi:hypothetical protein HYU12_01635 [Candidatus Woesearchaeota archaeon]|nr:hypothetical protein [Candidatus Woesearchaeota archaeon]